MEEAMTQQLPKTDSIEELAQFWDTHDVTEYEGNLEEAPDVVFAKSPSNELSIPLGAAELARIRRIAASRGVDETSLIQEWVRERLGQP